MNVYVLIDPKSDTDIVVSVHARHQGADLAAIEYAQRVAPSANLVEGVYKRLRIVNRDVQDDE
ncbi:hypothetical protein H7K45_27890 [Mycobacterium yunnanensis]|uniref:Uncharacterized protein n=1 Tax=Mycobacterium yunnanensis TaxID=368477 RepID=A0A9X3C3G8_9MYCO|nr:hypothetical protein [Mycobacterium yunnanensis]MCV7424373.1 hypothetical protein [Mycobacterium yunnanensis]